MPRPAPPPAEEFTIRFDGETWRSEDRSFMIGRAMLIKSGKPSTRIGVKGNIPFGSGGLEIGLNYVVHGRHEVHEKYGRQITVETWALDKPTSRDGYIKYLCRCKGNLTTRGIGQSTAAAMYAKYGDQCVEILRTDPDRVSREIPRFPVESARLCSEQLQALEGTEKTRIALHSLLSGFGFPRTTINKAIDKWGASAVEFLTRNPFLVMNFKGCGFLRADAFYRQVGQQRFSDSPAAMATWMASLKRQAYALAYELASDTDGHIWYSAERAIKGIKDRIAGADVQPERAIELARRGRLITVKVDPANPGKRWIADRRSADAEECVARKIAEALAEDAPAWPSAEEVKAADPELTDHQLAAYSAIKSSHVGLLIGSAGTGKTRLVAAIVKAIMAKCGAFSTCIATPTGKAGVRCTQAMQARGVDLRARTIHSTLGVESAEEGWVFTYREGNPLPFGFIVVDEASMVDCGLLASLLKSRSRGAHLLLVGDQMQLPPVGRGAPLRDFIRVLPAIGRLSEIHRNAGTVVKVCTAIRDKRPMRFDDRLDVDGNPPKNFQWIEASQAEAPAKVIELVKQIAAEGRFNPTWDVQVLVAVNQRSSLSRESMSAALQNLLNPNGKTHAGTKLRIGDKVLQTQNGFFRDHVKKSTDHFVANGDVGKVVSFREKTVIVEFFEPARTVEMPIGGTASTDDGGSGSGGDQSSGGGLVLAYAVTGHKMQGSQAPVVITCIDGYAGATGQFGIVDLHWLYTAFSRPSLLGYAVGPKFIAERCLGRSYINRRKTFLVERIRELTKAAGGTENSETTAAPSMDDAGNVRAAATERRDERWIAAGDARDVFPADLFA